MAIGEVFVQSLVSFSFLVTSSQLIKGNRRFRLGDNRHVMTYVIGAGKSFNVVLNHEDLSDHADWSQDKDSLLSNIREEFEGWGPVYAQSFRYFSLYASDIENRLSKIIGMIDKTLKWPLYSSSIMHSWFSGKLVVLGDAAHTMIPYLSQGMSYNITSRFRTH